MAAFQPVIRASLFVVGTRRLVTRAHHPVQRFTADNPRSTLERIYFNAMGQDAKAIADLRRTIRPDQSGS